MQRKKMLTAAIFRTTKSFLDRVAQHALEEKRLAHKNAIMNILNRTAIDETFCKELLFSDTKTLEQYELNWTEKAALISGDIQFIEKKTGPLTPVQKCWLLHRLEAEIW